MSGSFAELRTGHFHSGLDIKSAKGVSGDSIFSIQNGTISRLKVESGGYGNSIYIDHPEGFTSVYAHLKSYHPTLDSIILAHQQRIQQFGVDIRSFDTPISFKKGEFIAIMGNSGRSFGPHLHFEVRETSSDRLINPILLGIKPNDTRTPSIKYIELKQLDSLQLITDIKPLPLRKLPAGVNSKIYDLGKLFVSPHNTYILSLAMFDQMNGSSNKNGIYAIEWFKNDTLIQKISLDDLQFSDSNAIYELLDLHKKKESNATHYQLNLSRFHQYSFTSPPGLEVNPSPGADKYKYIFSDFEGNNVQLNYELEEIESSIQPNQAFKPNSLIHSKKPNLIRTKHFDIYIPANSTYRSQGVLCHEIESYGMAKLLMRPSYVSFSKYIEIKLKSKSNENIVSLVTTNDKNEQVLLATCEKLKDCTISTNQFMDVAITVDTIAPTIQMTSKSIINQNDRISFKITDNLIANKKELQLKFQVFVDEKWHLFDYDLKNDVISTTKLSALGLHNISVIVSDSSGNQTCSDYKVEIR